MSVFVWSDIHHDFKIATSGDIALVKNAEAVQTSLTNIMRTSYGERVMRRRFGCGCKHMLFELIDDDLRSIFIDNIYNDIKTWETRINLLSIDYQADPDRGSVSVFFKFSIKGYNDIFLHSVPL